MNGAVRRLDVGPAYERALAILERLHSENPKAIEEFLQLAARPHHTQTISLVFHGRRLKCSRIEYTETSVDGER